MQRLEVAGCRRLPEKHLQPLLVSGQLRLAHGQVVRAHRTPVIPVLLEKVLRVSHTSTAWGLRSAQQATEALLRRDQGQQQSSSRRTRTAQAWTATNPTSRLKSGSVALIPGTVSSAATVGGEVSNSSAVGGCRGGKILMVACAEGVKKGTRPLGSDESGPGPAEHAALLEAMPTPYGHPSTNLATAFMCQASASGYRRRVVTHPRSAESVATGLRPALTGQRHLRDKHRHTSRLGIAYVDVGIFSLSAAYPCGLTTRSATLMLLGALAAILRSPRKLPASCAASCAVGYRYAASIRSRLCGCSRGASLGCART
jgi:hypothetical protein